jgi:hypothetical protein
VPLHDRPRLAGDLGGGVGAAVVDDHDEVDAGYGGSSQHGCRDALGFTKGRDHDGGTLRAQVGHGAILAQPSGAVPTRRI